MQKFLQSFWKLIASFMAQRSGSTSSYDLHPSQQQSSVSTIWDSKSSAKLLSGVTQKCAVHRYAMEQKYMAAYNMKKYIPRGWDHNQYAVEIYVDAALRKHAWSVGTISAADVVFLTANMSLWCFVNKVFTFRGLWKNMAEDRELWSGPAADVPKVLSTQYGNCGTPWLSVRNGRRPANFTFLVDTLDHSPGGHGGADIVLPFLVSKPRWLVGSGKPPFALVPWAQRKLLFFAGHIPKLYISKVRYLIWRQLRNDARVTTFSTTLRCTVGSYSECHQSQEQLLSRGVHYFRTFCYKHCNLTSTLTPSTCSMGSGMGLQAAKAKFLSNCAIYGHLVNYTDEMADMVRDSRSLPHNEYLRTALHHRFCLVAPGDYVSTHKIGEAMAFGSTGGCIPVFVVIGTKGERRHRVQSMLPYTRWLDYCQVGYFVSSEAATTRMGDVLNGLAMVSDSEATEKLRKLRLVRDAFVFRQQSSVSKPSAAEFIIGEVCSQTLEARRAQQSAPSEQTSASACFGCTQSDNCWIADS